MQTFGEKIRKLRLSCGLNQTQLADKLGLSNQAVSKWETNAALPDISLLPDLATVFGVSIDELFDYTKDKMYDKISNQLESGYPLSYNEFQRFESFLHDEIHQNPLNYRATSELGFLYHSQAKQLQELAVTYAKKALDLQPNSKFDINIINNASQGAIYDWDTGGHHELIDYYQKLLKASPENKRVYLYLLDNLLADGRLSEAKTTLEDAIKHNPDNLNHFYAILIEEKTAGFLTVQEKYLLLADQFPNDWRVLYAIANQFCKNDAYRLAIPLWQRAFEAKEKPRYTDFHESIAICHLRLGERKQAIKAYQKCLDIMRDDWNLRFGKQIDRIKATIDQLS